MTQTLSNPNSELLVELSNEWTVIIFNNDTSSMDEVIHILMVATQCSQDEAVTECLEAHTTGKCRVHYSDKLDCERVASIISNVGVKTEVCKEWVD